MNKKLVLCLKIKNIDAVFILTWFQEYCAKRKKVVCFIELGKVSNRLQRKELEWMMRKNGILEVTVSLYEGTNTRVGVNSEWSDEIEIKEWMYSGHVLSLLFMDVVNVLTELVNECLFC